MKVIFMLCGQESKVMELSALPNVDDCVWVRFDYFEDAETMRAWAYDLYCVDEDKITCTVRSRLFDVESGEHTIFLEN